MLLLVLVRNSNWQLTYARFFELPATLVLVCVSGWLLSFIFRAIRFRLEWQMQGHVSFFQALHVTFLHNAAVVLVPFRVGELGYPVLVRNLFDVSWQKCIRSLLWLRLQDAVVLLAIAFLMWPSFSPEIRALVLFFCVGLVLLTQKHWLRLLRSRLFLARQLRAFLHQRSGAWSWVCSAANWICKITVVAIMLQSLTGLPILQSLDGALTGELSAMLPITGPAGLGTYEAAVWAGLGLPWAEMKSLMASILFSHLFFLSISLLGALISLLLHSFFSNKNNVIKDNAHV
jgi:uncharacterized membrane protein YbhN (UPF0104 family)